MLVTKSVAAKTANTVSVAGSHVTRRGEVSFACITKMIDQSIRLTETKLICLLTLLSQSLFDSSYIFVK